MKLVNWAGNIGIGLLAGLAGTAAITASQAIESRWRHREPSVAPAKALENVLEILPADARAESRLGQLVHWSYGTGWGAFRGLLGAFGLRGLPASAVHLAAVQGAAFVVLPATQAAPPPGQWGASEVAIDVMHHAIYALAVGAVFDALTEAPVRTRRPVALLDRLKSVDVASLLPLKVAATGLVAALAAFARERDLPARVDDLAAQGREAITTAEAVTERAKALVT